MIALAAVAVTSALLLPGVARRARLRGWPRPSVPAALARSRGRTPAVLLLGIGGAGAAVSVGRPAVIVGLAVATGLVLRRRHRQAARVSARDLTVTVDVLGGCVAAGASTAAAVAASAVAAPPDVAATLTVASLALSRGEDPSVVWSRVEARVPELAEVSRLCARAAITGAAAADDLHRIAAAMRVSADVSRRRRLQRASVWLVLPLGACFLPAFVLVGVVPLVVGTLPALSR